MLPSLVGFHLSPAPESAAIPGATGFWLVNRTPGVGVGGCLWQGGGGSDDFEADFVRESLGCCLLAGPPVPQDAPGVREPQPKYPFV